MRIVLALLVAVALAACSTFRAEAEGITRHSRVAAPAYLVPDEAPAYKAHNWYGGVAGGYAWTPDEDCGPSCDDVWHGGIVGGYLWRPTPGLGLGIEGDYSVRDLGDFAIDDGVASVRARAGVFVLPGTFVYGTGGVAHATEAAAPPGARKGPVVGLGVEQDVQGMNAAIRAEVLHYRHSDEYTDWGDFGSTAGRVGLVFKF